MSQKYLSLRFGKVVKACQEMVVIRYNNGKEETFHVSGNYLEGDSVCVRDSDGKKVLFSSARHALQSIDFEK